MKQAILLLAVYIIKKISKDTKDKHPVTRESDKIKSNYNTAHFKTGVAPRYNLELNDIMDKI
jgi:hypothetical protein